MCFGLCKIEWKAKMFLRFVMTSYLLVMVYMILFICCVLPKISVKRRKHLLLALNLHLLLPLFYQKGFYLLS